MKAITSRVFVFIMALALLMLAACADEFAPVSSTPESPSLGVTESKPVSEKLQNDMQGFQAIINIMVGIMADPNHFVDAHGAERESYVTTASLFFKTAGEFRQKLPELMKPKVKEANNRKAKTEQNKVPA